MKNLVLVLFYRLILISTLMDELLEQDIPQIINHANWAPNEGKGRVCAILLFPLPPSSIGVVHFTSLIGYRSVCLGMPRASFLDVGVKNMSEHWT